MIEIRKTDVFAAWLDGLRDIQATSSRSAKGSRSCGSTTVPRINYGPGYRVYFKQRGRELILLLAGGDKSTQAKDIKTALRLARDFTE